MAITDFSEDPIKTLVYEGDGRKRDIRWDEKEPGFGVRIYPPTKRFSKGRKVFVFQYRHEGNRKLIQIGEFGPWTLDKARKRARALKVQVGDGDDPLGEREKARKGKSFGDLMDAYIERHAKLHKKTWRKDEQRFDLYIPQRWRSRPAASISRGEIAGLHADITRRGAIDPKRRRRGGAAYEANRTVEVLRKMFNLARVWEFTGFEDGTKQNPAEGITRNKEVKRKRFLRPDEWAALVSAIDAESNLMGRAVIWLLLLTGMRKSELVSARWSWVDLDAAVIRLPDTKSGEEQIAPLSGAAIAILQAMPKVDGNPHIFVGEKKGQHLIGLDRIWYRVRDAATLKLWSSDAKLGALIRRLKGELGRLPRIAEVREAAEANNIDPTPGLLDFRLHDLRRSVGSWMAQAGTDLQVIRDGLRHANISTTLIYARLGADPARQAMEEHGRRVMERSGKAVPAEVVDFPEAAG